MSTPTPLIHVNSEQAISGTFVEFRNGMINVSPIGRNATYVSVSLTKIQVPDELLVSIQERLDFLAYDEVCLPCELIPLFKLKFI